MKGVMPIAVPLRELCKHSTQKWKVNQEEGYLEVMQHGVASRFW